MKRFPAFIKELFGPKELHNLDVQDLLGAMSDPVVRKVWLAGVFEDLQRLNLDVDKCLLSTGQVHITDLAARRKAFQDILEGILTARRRVRDPNPRSGSFDLDSVTVQPA